LVLSDPVVGVVRRELRKVSPGVKIGNDEVRDLLEREVLKREVTEGDKAMEAYKKVNKAQCKEAKAKTKGASDRSEADTCSGSIEGASSDNTPGSESSN
jgi:hypothetical protein